MEITTYRKHVFHVRFEVFTAVTMKKAVFWDVAPCRSGTFLRNVGYHHFYTVPHPRRLLSSCLSWFVTSTNYSWGDQIKKAEVSCSCSRHERNKK
jgi:hypothetical protein